MFQNSPIALSAARASSQPVIGPRWRKPRRDAAVGLGAA
jgi:hypothetical protein